MPFENLSVCLAVEVAMHSQPKSLSVLVLLTLVVLLAACAAPTPSVTLSPSATPLAPTATHFPIPAHIFTEVAKLDPEEFQLVYTVDGWALLTREGTVVIRAGSQPDMISITLKGGEIKTYSAGSYEVVWPATTPTPSQ